MNKKYINYLKNLDAEASGLLGFFDADDNYVIDQDIIQELIICNKIIDSFSDNKILATAKVGDAKLKFVVYIQDGENNQKRAGLFVLEKSTLGFIDKDLQTYVHSVVLKNDANFFIEIKKAFHLYAQDESEGVDIDNATLLKIQERLKKLKMHYEAMLMASIPADKAYVLKMLALIKTAGPYGQQFLLELKKRIELKKLTKADKKYWRELKLMIDSMLLKNKDVFAGPVLDKMILLQEAYLSAIKNVKIMAPEEVVTAQKKKKSDDKKKKKKAGKDKKADKKKKKGGSKGSAAVKPATPSKDVPREFKPKPTRTKKNNLEAENDYSSFLGEWVDQNKQRNNLPPRVDERDRGR